MTAAAKPLTRIRRVLIANRGEIAVRVIRACSALGLESVAIHSDADRDSLAARLANQAVCIGPAPAAKSYLMLETILHAARATGCDAIHPGSGFLSEREAFARRCAEEGLIFVGPSSSAIAMMGNKIAARQAAIAAGVPTLPGSIKIASASEAATLARDIGYPVLLKAAAGGGGRGMKVAHTADELSTAFALASSEAEAAFGDGTLYIERFLQNARHVEVQVLGDAYGNVIHIGERDCSLQRRHQKMVEEAPAPFIPADVLECMRSSAVALARAVRYENAGTVEFIFDRDRNEFFFLEMNTRIQVEHPVTEAISGIDLVQEQIRIADGAPLRITQNDVLLRGHAIEARVNAEDPDQGFRPQPGRFGQWSSPTIPGVRIDTHCFPGYRVPPFYDSMIAKVIAHAPTREQAIAKLDKALGELTIQGIATNIPFVRELLSDQRFLTDNFSTNLIERHLLEKEKHAA
ncbi:MAG: acetyl-CoA carboxylase biotin carboxylase subunit [Pseudolabrys sp.]